LTNYRWQRHIYF